MAYPDPVRRSQTRQKIIDAFWNVYEHIPYNQIKIKNITDEAQCNRSTFYEYFDSLDDLLDQAQDQLIDEIREYLEMYYANIRSKNFQAIFDMAAITYSENAEKLNLLLGPASSFLAKYSDTLRPYLIDSIGLNAQDPEDCFAVDMVSFSTIATIAVWYQEGKPISEYSLAKLSVSWSNKGIVPTLQSLSNSEESAEIETNEDEA